MKSVILKNKNIFTNRLSLVGSDINVSSYKFIYDVNDFRVFDNSECVIHVSGYDIHYIKGHNTYIHNTTYQSNIDDIKHLNNLNIHGVYIDMDPEHKDYSYINKWEIHYNGYMFKLRNVPVPGFLLFSIYFNKVELFYDEGLLYDKKSGIDEYLILGLLSYCWFHFYYDDHVISFETH